MMAAARGYHKREDKPFWWAHFDRLNNPVDEWSDNTDVFIAERAEVAHRLASPAARRASRSGGCAHGEHRGRRTRQVDVRALRAARRPPASPTTRSGGRAARSGRRLRRPGAPTEVIVVEREPKDGGLFDQLPFALTPGPPISTRPLRDSIEATAADIAAGLPNLPPSAVIDILLRRPPRTRSGGPLPGMAMSPSRSPRRSSTWTRRTSRCTARPAPVRRSPRRPSSLASSPKTVGASAWSRSRTRSSRTCSATWSLQEWTHRWWPRRSTAPTRAGRRSTRSSTRASSPTMTVASSAAPHGTSPTRAGCRAAASTCWSSKRPDSTAWRIPSRWRRLRKTFCCLAIRNSCLRSARAHIQNRWTPPRWAG